MGKSIVKMSGRLGNQMFIHAFAKRLAEEKSSNIIYDISFYKNDDYLLNKFFNIDVKTTYKNYDTFFNKIFRVKERKLNCYDPKIFSYPGYFYKGYFQTEKYFKKYRPELIKEFKCKISFDNEYLSVLDKIENSNSVLLNFRVAQDYRNIGWQVSFDYQLQAMEYISSKIDNIKYFVFADDIKYIEENFKTDKNLTFVDIGKNNPYKICLDLELMKKCKHDIIPNSSFSWWAAWLNENPDKIVIAPEPWFFRQNDIIPDDWHKIHSEKLYCENKVIT